MRLRATLNEKPRRGSSRRSGFGYCRNQSATGGREQIWDVAYMYERETSVLHPK